MGKKQFIAALVVGLTFCTGATALSDVDQDRLVEALRSGQEAGLVEARQMLPRAGTDVLEEVLDALALEDERIWRTARNIIADIANRASGPGYAEAKRTVAEALTERLAATDDPRLQEQLMRLLPIPAHDDMNLAPVASLLNGGDAIMAEKARACLKEIGTTAAAETLAEALNDATPEFRVAILNALGRLKKSATPDAVAKYLSAEEPGVRIAAARAVAWTGSPRYLSTFRGLPSGATASTRDEAWHALLRYTHAMGMNGGNWTTTLDLFEQVLNEAESTALRGAAISGLGQFGDERAVMRIAEVVTAEGGEDLEGPALEAFRHQDSTAGRAALADAYPTLSPNLRANVLRLLGDLGHAEAVQAFYSADPEKGNPMTRTAAVDAMAATLSPAALPVIAEYIGEVSDEEQAEAVGVLMQLARGYEETGAKEDAGNAFLLAYRNTADEALRKAALHGVKRNPVPAATDIFLQELETANLEDFPISTLLALRNALKTEGRAEDADRVTDALTERLASTAAVQAVINLANQEGTQEAWKGKLGFVRKWHIVGPLPNEREDDAAWAPPPFEPSNVDLSATFTDGEVSRTWQAQETGDLGGMFNLMGLLGAHEQVRAFAYTTLNAASAQDAVLRIGSDDGVRVWVNGEQVHANPADRGAVLDQDLVPVSLKAGPNAVLLEIVQYAGGWTFLMRVTDPQGAPLNL